MRLSTLLLTSSASLALAGAASAQAVFTPIGGNSTRPTDLSPDGTWVAGYDFNGAFRWSAGTGFDTWLSGFNGEPGIPNGGSPVAVSMINGGGDEEAALWTTGGTTFLGGIGGQSGTSISSAYGCNADASVVVGLAWVNAGTAHAFKWDSVNGMVDLGANFGSSRANNVSGDGSLVVGWDSDTSGFRRAAYWPGGVPTFLSANAGESWGVNNDGSVIVGVDANAAFRWTSGTGLVSLGKLPGSVSGDQAFAVGVSDDGNTVVGFNGNNFFGTPFRAFIWRPGAGMVEVEQLVTALGGTIPPSFATLSSAVAVSADGNTIAGQSGAFPFGPFEGWVLTLPPVATNYCTGKVNSQGCLTAIGHSGTPSASSGSGFHVTASNIIPGTNGLMFYSTAGPASVPFQGGFLCVSSPTFRTSLQSSGGSAACSGTFDFDFNAYVATGFDPALVSGAKVWAQYWSRDPASPSTTNLTDALEFTLWP